MRNTMYVALVAFLCMVNSMTTSFAQDHGYFRAEDISALIANSGASEEQAYEEALSRATNLIRNHTAFIDEFITKRRQIMELPERENFLGIKFSRLGFTKEFDCKERRATRFSADTDVAVSFLPETIIGAVNEAIKRSYSSGFKRYGDFRVGTSYQLIKQGEVGARQRYISLSACQRDSDCQNLGGSIEGDFQQVLAAHRQMLLRAKQFYESYSYPKKGLFGGSKRYIKKEHSHRDDQWEGFIEAHEEFLARELQLVNEARGAASQHIRYNARGVLEAITRSYQTAKAMDHVDNLPAKYREQISRRIRRAYIEGVRDGLKQAVNKYLVFVPREYTWRARAYDGQVYRYRATRYTAVWRRYFRPFGNVDYSGRILPSDRVVARFCTMPMASVRVTDDGERVALGFTVQLPDGDYAHTRYVYLNAYNGFNGDSAFLAFLDAAYAIAYDYDSIWDRDIVYGDGWSSDWGHNYGYDKDDWNEGNWNDAAGSTGGTDTWNDPSYSTPSSGTGNTWNDKPEGNTEYHDGSGWNDEAPSGWNGSGHSASSHEPSNDPNSGWNDINNSTPPSW